MKIPFLTNGPKVIDGVFKEFERQQEQLRYGMELCQTEIVNKDEEIKKLNIERSAIVEYKDKADRLLTKLSALLK